MDSRTLYPRDFTLQTSTEELVAAFQADSTPGAVPAEDWREFRSRFQEYLDEFGHTSYEFDFMNPTPAETPAVILGTLKLYVEGKGTDPYTRQREAAEKREQTLSQIRSGFKLIPNRWFDKVIKWALRVGPDREDRGKTQVLQWSIEHLFEQKHQRVERLVLRARRNPPLSRKTGQEPLHLSRTQALRGAITTTE